MLLTRCLPRRLSRNIQVSLLQFGPANAQQRTAYSNAVDLKKKAIRIKRPEIDLPKAWEQWHRAQDIQNNLPDYIPRHFDNSKHTDTIEFSGEQLRIFDEICEHKFDALVVDAKAGSGKTKTIVESVKYLPKDATVLLLAYNRNIATLLDYHASLKENKAHSPDRLVCSTFHSMGLRMWCSHLGKPVDQFLINPRKTFIIFKSLVGANDLEFRKYYLEVADLVNKAKLHGLAPSSLAVNGSLGLIEDSFEQWQSLIKLYKIKIKPSQNEGQLIEYARKVLERSVRLAGGGLKADPFLSKLSFALDTELEHGKFLLDFDDILYMPVVEQVDCEFSFDFIFVDEAQDLSEVRVELIQRLRKNGGSKGKLAIFGDRHQAIYGFAGCTSGFFGKLYDEGSKRNVGELATMSLPEPESAKVSGELADKVKTLPLSTCYRCPTDVVEMAQYFVSDIQARKDAPVGVVRMLSYKWTPQMLLNSPSLVVAREMKVLVNFAFYLLSKGISFGFMGRNIGPKPVESLVHALLLGMSMDSERLADEVAIASSHSKFAGNAGASDWKPAAEADRLLADSPIANDPLVNPAVFELPIAALIKSAENWHRNLITGETYIEESFDAASVEDRFDSLLNIVAFAQTPLRTIGDFLSYLESRFMAPFRASGQLDGFPGLLLSTMHQSRGLERDSVYLLNESDWKERFQGKWLAMPRIWYWWQWKQNREVEASEWAVAQERNLMYVAWTRAKNGLYFIDWQEREELGQLKRTAMEHELENPRVQGGSVADQLAQAKEAETNLKLIDRRYLIAKRRDRHTGEVKELRRRPYLNQLNETLSTVTGDEQYVTHYNESRYFDHSVMELYKRAPSLEGTIAKSTS